MDRQRWSSRKIAAVAATLCLGAGVGIAVPLAGAEPTTTTGPSTTAPPTTTGPTTTAPPGTTTAPPGTTTEPSPQPSGEEPATTMPANPASGDRPKQGTGLPEGLGGQSPACQWKNIGPDAVKRCGLSGGISNAYPSDNYGLDNNVDAGVTNPGSWLASAVQWLIGIIWLALVYFLKMVLLMIDWSFSLDLYGKTEGDTAKGMAQIYAIIGSPWMTFALACAGLWGLWNGLVRRRAIETAGGLAMTVALMVAGLLITSQPRQTVGYVSALVNQGSLSALSAASAGTVNEPAKNYAEAQKGLFDAMVLRPWCAMQFGDVDYCTRPVKDGMSVADVWLSFTPNSEARALLYQRTAKGADAGPDFGDRLQNAVRIGWDFVTGGGLVNPGQGAANAATRDAARRAQQEAVAKKAAGIVEKSPQHVQLQEGGGTVRRVALLLIVGGGMLGAGLLLGSLGIRLVVQGSLMTILLLLLAPLFTLAACFGKAGRDAAVGYGKRLFVAVASEFFYSLLIAVVFLTSGILAGLDDELGWLPAWLLQSSFWWALFLRRRELLGALALDNSPAGGGIANYYYTWRMARETGGMAWRGITSPVRAVARPLRRNLELTRNAEEQMVREQSDEMAGERAREVVANDHEREYADAQEILSVAAGEQSQLDDVQDDLRSVNRRLEHAPEGQGESLRNEQERLRNLRNALRQSLNSPQVAHARSVAARGPVAPHMSDAEVARWTAQRRWDIANRPWHSAENLRAAGIDPAEAARSQTGNPERYREMERLVRQQMREDSVRLARAYERDPVPLTRRERSARVDYARNRTGAARFDAQLEAQVRVERRRARAERARRRGIYR